MQACISVEQIYIEDDIFDDFTEKISTRVEKMSAGETAEDSIGCIITPENYDKINSHLSDLEKSTQMIKGDTKNNNIYASPISVISNSII